MTVFLRAKLSSILWGASARSAGVIIRRGWRGKKIRRRRLRLREVGSRRNRSDLITFIYLNKL
jgi:hypothetical protein